MMLLARLMGWMRLGGLRFPRAFAARLGLCAGCCLRGRGLLLRTGMRTVGLMRIAMDLRVMWGRYAVMAGLGARAERPIGIDPALVRRLDFPRGPIARDCGLVDRIGAGLARIGRSGKLRARLAGCQGEAQEKKCSAHGLIAHAGSMRIVHAL